MHNKKLFSGLLLLTILLAGCASGVSRVPGQEQAQFSWSADNPFGSVDLVLTPSGKESVKDNLKFDPKALKNHVERALAAGSLIAKSTEGRLPHLIVEVKDVRVRSNFSAVMWGFMAGNDHITGDVVIVDPLSGELDRFEVSASYALGGFAGGVDSARMGWLYEAFAEETINELTKGNVSGAVVKSRFIESDSQNIANESEASSTSPAMQDSHLMQSDAMKSPAPDYKQQKTNDSIPSAKKAAKTVEYNSAEMVVAVDEGLVDERMEECLDYFGYSSCDRKIVKQKLILEIQKERKRKAIDLYLLQLERNSN